MALRLAEEPTITGKAATDGRNLISIALATDFNVTSLVSLRSI
jgi:hypothetical protein